jgi:hypothetical protein
MSRPFDPIIIDRIDKWSKHVFKTSKDRSPEELVLAGFFSKREIMRHVPKSCAPLGTVVHYVPKNVDTTFAYVLLISMLCGNKNIVKLTSDAAVRQRQLKLLMELDDMVAAVSVVGVGNNEELNVALAQGPCDSRVIWGGDSTINEIRKAPVKPWAREMTFHDRRSIAVLDAADSLQRDHTTITKVIRDAMWMEQASCTSVRGVVWLGTDEQVKHAIARFTIRLETAAVERLAFMQSELIKGSDVSGSYNELLNVRCKFDEFESAVRSCSVPGVLYHMHAENVDRIPDFANRALQTVVTNVGRQDVHPALLNRMHEERFCDRIVSPGRSMEFSWTWDGYDLVTHLTHCVEVL